VAALGARTRQRQGILTALERRGALPCARSSPADFDRVDRVAALLGLRCVGSIFTARPRKCILSSRDIMLACSIQAPAPPTPPRAAARRG